MEKSDVYLGGVTALFAVVLWFYLIPTYIVVPGNIPNFYMAPNFWVNVIALSLFFLGGGLMIKALKMPRSKIEVSSFGPKIIRLVAGLAIFLAFYILLDLLGIIVTSFLAILASSMLYGERRYKYLVPLAALLPTGLYLFFLKIASIPMPQGILAGISPF